MWAVKYKENNESQSWSTLDNYYSSASAIVRATRVSRDYFMIMVTGPDGIVIWSN